MPHDLTEIDQRIEFSEDQSSSLAKEIKSFLDEHLEITHRDKPGEVYDVYGIISAAIPTSLKSKAGLIAHELRACLDSLACVLAIRNGAKKVREVSFPIFKTKQHFDDCAMKRIKLLSDQDQQKIVDLMPFGGGHPYLWKLHEADRTRKHQKLAASAVGNDANIANLLVIQGPQKFCIKGIVFEDVAVDNFTCGGSDALISDVGTAYLLASNVPFDLDFNLAFGFTYLEPEDVAGLDVSNTLQHFARTVRDVVGCFR